MTQSSFFVPLYHSTHPIVSFLLKKLLLLAATKTQLRRKSTHTHTHMRDRQREGERRVCVKERGRVRGNGGEREEYECVREGVSWGKREKGVCEKESERDCA